MVIKTATRQGSPTIPGKKPIRLLYEFGKQTLIAHGYYEDIKQYDPGYYIEKYSYKPVKRIAGHAGQKIYGFPKKKRFFAKTCKIHEKRSICGR